MAKNKVPKGQQGLGLSNLAWNAYKSSRLIPKVSLRTMLPKDGVSPNALVGMSSTAPINPIAIPKLLPGDPFAIQKPWVPTGGKNVLLDDSGNNVELNADEKNRISTGRELPNIRPLVDVANYLTERNAIDKVRKTQLARKNLYQNAPSLAVRPIQDLSPEILAEQQNAITQNRSDYAGSDPVMNMLSKNTATAQRGKMRGDFIAGRSENLAKERTRFDEQTRANQQAAAETAAKNVDREQEFQDYKTGANVASIEAKKQLNSQFLNQIGMNLDTAAEYNLKAKAMEEQNARQKFEDAVSMAYMEPDEAKRTEMLNAITLKYPKGYTASLLPNYYRAQAGGLKGSFIGNLMTRGMYTPKPGVTP